MKKSAAVILVIVLLVTLAMVVPIVARSMRQSKISACAGRLHALWHLRAHLYASSNDDRLHPNGGRYFLSIQGARELHGEGMETYYCPLTDDERIPGRTSYRGPAFPLRKLVESDPCAADREGNHGPGEGGNVLTMFGDVKEVGASDPLWIRARVTTKE